MWKNNFLWGSQKLHNSNFFPKVLIGLNYINIWSNFHHETTPNILYFEYKVNTIHLELSYCICLVLICRKWRKTKKNEEKCPVRPHGFRYGHTKYLDGFLDARQFWKGIISYSSKSVRTHRKSPSVVRITVHPHCGWLGRTVAEHRKIRVQCGRTVHPVRMAWPHCSRMQK